jgi:pantoate--beta-alanine ligase
VPKAPKKVSTLSALRRTIDAWRLAGDTIGLVPTMGALHDGHLSLVEQARRRTDRVVVSIFVNPTQFAAHEDLDRYPSDPAGDTQKLATSGVDLIWSPKADGMYHPQHATSIVPEGAALGLEGAFRPHHFQGVATVCCKLFHQVRPDIAVFGEKDYQQLCVLRQMVRDLDFDLRLIAGRTIRERDGLAMSSRNRYLSAQHRTIAPALIAALKSAAHRVADGATPRQAEKYATAALKKAGFDKIDYVAIRDAETLGPLDHKAKRRGRILAAAWLGKTRLIDNWPVRL